MSVVFRLSSLPRIPASVGSSTGSKICSLAVFLAWSISASPSVGWAAAAARSWLRAITPSSPWLALSSPAKSAICEPSCRWRVFSQVCHHRGLVRSTLVLRSSSSCSRSNCWHTRPVGPAFIAALFHNRTTLPVRSRSAAESMVSSTA